MIDHGTESIVDAIKGRLAALDAGDVAAVGGQVAHDWLASQSDDIGYLLERVETLEAALRESTPDECGPCCNHGYVGAAHGCCQHDGARSLLAAFKAEATS